MIAAPSPRSPLAAADRGWLLGIAAATSMVVLLATLLGPYGYFIDELYYLACARRPALGYVDHPPLAPLVLGAVRLIGGESLVAIRIVPAVCAGVTTYLSGLLAHQLGGGRFAMCTAALGVAAAPFLGVMSSFFSMNAIELVLWACALLVMARIADRPTPSRWLALGALLGVGFLNKHTIVLLVAGLGLGVLCTPLRRRLLTVWPWLAVGLALLLALPNIGWQMANGWPSLEFYREATAHKNVPTSPLGVLGNVLLVFHPLFLPLWGTGAVALLVSARFRQARVLGIAFWALLGLMVVSRTSRPDRVAGLAVALFAAGAVVWESWLQSRWARRAVTAAVLLCGVALAPLNLPLLPAELTGRYAALLRATPQIERGKTSPLPQWLADRTGWEDFIAQIDAVLATLSAEDRGRALLFAPDYGHAGAMELWGRARGFPPVICTQNSYYHWSIGHTDSEVLITVGASESRLRQLFGEVNRVGTVTCSTCMSWRNGRAIHVSRRPIVPLSSVWPELRHYE